MVVAAATRIAQPSGDGDAWYWTERRPHEGGRVVLVRRLEDGAEQDVTRPGFNVRTTVHEYGGRAYLVRLGVVWFVNFDDQRIYRQEGVGPPVPVTPEAPYRYADLQYDAGRERLLAVREDHRKAPLEAETTIVALNPLEDREGSVILAAGRTFYAHPRLSPDGRALLWLEWDHPHMPWDATQLMLADVAADGTLLNVQRLAGGADEAVVQPEWSPDGVATYLSDRSGWWNLYRVEGEGERQLAPREAEFAEPSWTLGETSYVYADAGRIFAIYQVEGRSHVAWIDLASGRPGEVATGYTAIHSACLGPGAVGFLGASWDAETELAQVDLRTGLLTVVKGGRPVPVDRRFVSRAEAIEFQGHAGSTAHAFFYAPKNLEYAASETERPPLVMFVHGGPTGFSDAALDLEVQYWTTRGFAVVDVNYGGSSGYGRAYRERLRGQWGVVDVDDVVGAARYLAAVSRVDGARMVIRGGSAGGYTTLAALVFRDVFRAGASYFGVSDLAALARDTHKFESHYLDGLVGPWPEAEEIYASRSPLLHTDRLAVPVIFFQGLIDRVVPPNQAERMVEALDAKGIPVAYLTFEGEGHGFRRAENIKRALEAEFAFYCRVFGLKPPDAPEEPPIRNLS
jgi:dipeptidyl aminopeptidase/acylaminoacyl peptidase